MTDHIHRVTAAGDTVDIDVDIASADGHITLDFHVDVTPAPPAVPPTSMVDLLAARIGNSGAMGYAPGGDADPGFRVGEPNEAVRYNARYSKAAPPPPTFIDFPASGVLGPMSLYADPSDLSMGSEITLGSTLLTAVARPCVLKAMPVSGSGLAVEWDPDGTYPAPGEGNLYHQMVAYVRAFEVQVGRLLDAIVIEWGNADAHDPDHAAAFHGNCVNAIARLRVDFPGVAIVLERPNVHVPNLYQGVVIAAIDAIAAADPTVRVVDTDDCPLAESHHATANGYLTQGQREGFAIIRERGLPEQAPAELTVVGWGPEVHGTGNLTAIPWAGSQPGDLEVMPVVVGLGELGTVTPDATWTLENESGDAAAIGVHAQMLVFTREVTAELLAGRRWTPAASLAIAGTTRNAAKIFTVRGPTPGPLVAYSQGFASSVYGTGPTMIPDVAGAGLRLWFTGGFSGQDPLSTLTLPGGAPVRKVQDSACNILTDREVITLHTSADPGPAILTSTASLLVVSNTLRIA